MPGYNEFVKNQREIAMLWHWLWKDNGKPRNGYYAEMRRSTRPQFHYAVKMLKGMLVSSDQQECLKLLLRVIIVTCGGKADE